MNLFEKDGHLTQEALHAAVAEMLDEMSRLEVAEHLSFCDGCLERYTALLTDDTLRTPVQPIAPPVLSRIRKRAVAIVFNRYTTYAAAACLALALWGAGVFTSLSMPKLWETQEGAQAAATSLTTGNFVMQAGDFLTGVSRSMYDMLENVLPDHTPKPSAASTAAGKA